MDHRAGKAEARLDLMSSPNEVFEYYQHDRTKLIEVIERLLGLKECGLVVRVLRDESDHLLKSDRSLKCVLSLIRRHYKEFDDSSFLDTLIEILMEIALGHPFPFESFKTCQVISDLVIQNRRFPSKSLAKSYFARISAFFRESSQFLAYLNSLHILNELESMEFSRREFEFLKRCAILKAERLPKDLFCGIKVRDVESITVDVLTDAAGFAHDPMWDAVLDDSGSLPNDMKTAAFLMKNGIRYELVGDKIKVLGGSPEGFTTTVFNIVSLYEPVFSRAENIVSEPNVSTNADKSTKPGGSVLVSGENSSVNADRDSEPAKKTLGFKNRFALPYKQLKIINRHAPIDFEDRFHEERNERRMECFHAMNKRFEEEKAFFITRKEAVSSLLSQLGKMVEKRHSDQRVETEERMKLEESRLREEQQSKMWSNLSRGNTNLSNQRKEFAESREGSTSKLLTGDSFKTSGGLNGGVYVPKFSTLDASEDSSSALYIPKFHTTGTFRPAGGIHSPEPLSVDISAKSAEKAPGSSKDISETSSCSVSWGNLRKRKNS